MIKRKYFISIEKPVCDGTGNVATTWYTFTFKSWLPDHDGALDWAIERSKKALNDLKGDHLRVIAFNRVK